MAGQDAGARVEGGPQLKRALGNLGRRLELNDTPAHADAGELVATSARRLVPVQSGALLGTLEVDPHAAGAAILAGRSSVPYAGPIHFGWPARNIEPQPFLYDALDERRADVFGRYADEVAGIVRTFDREAPP